MKRILLFVFLASLGALAQSNQLDNTTNTNVVVAKLSAPIYPQLAITARIQGAVKLTVTVRANGSVESVDVLSGHPLLVKAASDSAQQSEFQCKQCVSSMQYPMTYNFELGDTIDCSGIDATGKAEFEPHQPQITQSKDSVTIVDHPIATCDPRTSLTFVKVRTAKCLFLWRCSRRYPL